MLLLIFRGISWIVFDFRSYLMIQAGEENEISATLVQLYDLEIKTVPIAAARKEVRQEEKL